MASANGTDYAASTHGDPHGDLGDTNPREEPARVEAPSETAPSETTLVFTSYGESFGAAATHLNARHHRYVADESVELGGSDLGANPVELALGGLIACQAVTYRVWAEKLGIALGDVKIHAEGDLDIRGFLGTQGGVRPGFSQVRLTVSISGPESQERYQELHAAVDAHCPVFDLFSHPTPVTTTIAVE